MTQNHSAQLLKDVLPAAPSGGTPAGGGKPSASGLSPRALEVAESLQKTVISRSVLSGLVRLTDIGIVAIIGAIALTGGFSGQTALSDVFAALGIALLLTPTFLQAADCYQLPVMRNVVSQGARTTIAWTLVFAALVMIKNFSGLLGGIADTQFSIWFGLGLSTLLAARFAVSLFVRKWTKDGRLERRAVIVGGGQAAADFIHEVESQPNNDIRICGLFDDRKGSRSPEVVAGYPKLGP